MVTLTTYALQLFDALSDSNIYPETSGVQYPVR